MSSVNVLHILRTIKDRASISRTDLQHITDLSWGTITNITRELLNRNLIREEGALSTKAGRKPVRLAINPTSHALVGLNIAAEGIDCLVLNLPGDTLYFEQAPASAVRNNSSEAVLEQAAAMLHRALLAPAVASRVCLGIGIALPGGLDVKQGLLRSAPHLPGWRDVPVREFLQTRLSAPVLIEHNPNCLALAERWFGLAGQSDDLLCIHLGQGVGMGILLHGEIFRGSQQMAGEFGHTTLDPNGPPCACGDHGCVESYCSIAAVLEYARKITTPGSAAAQAITIDELVTLAGTSDAGAQECFTRVGTHLGIGISNLVDLFNPHLIVLTGQLAGANAHFMPALEAELTRHAWKHSSRQLQISKLGPRATVMGACGLILQSVFSQDILPEVLSA